MAPSLVRWVLLPVVAFLLANFSVVVWQHVGAAWWGSAFDAAQYGYVQRLQSLNASGVDLQSLRDDQGNSLLHVARDAETIEYLAQVCGIDTNAANTQGVGVVEHMLSAAGDEWGNFDRLRALLMHGAKVPGVIEYPKVSENAHVSGTNKSSEEGTTRAPPLVLLWRSWETVSKHRYNMTRLLLQHGADPIAVDAEGRNMLHHIAKGLSTRTHAPEAVAMFFAAVDAAVVGLLRTPSSSQSTRSHMSTATRAGQHALSLWTNARDVEGRTPLATLAALSSPFHNNPDVASLAQKLLTLSADPTEGDARGVDAVCWAAFKGTPDLLRTILSQDAGGASSGGSSDEHSAEVGRRRDGSTDDHREQRTARRAASVRQAVSCAVLSPAYERMAHRAGVLDVLKAEGATPTFRHLDLFSNLWGVEEKKGEGKGKGKAEGKPSGARVEGAGGQGNEGVESQKASVDLTASEEWLTNEAHKYGKHHKPDNAVLRSSFGGLQDRVKEVAIPKGKPHPQTH